MVSSKRLGLAVGVMISAAAALGCGPNDTDTSDYVIKSGLRLDTNGRTVVKRTMISRPELRAMEDVRRKIGSGELRNQDVSSYLHRVHGGLGEASYVLNHPVAEENWALSHWMYRHDGWEIFELMPGSMAGAGDLSQWTYGDGSTLIASSGFFAGNFTAEFCTQFHIPCGDIVTTYGKYHYAVPAPFSFESYRVLGLRTGE
jgi:hypothetical protein